MERRQSSTHKIKGKLISALCMLLVAATMVVSSTYAWFTLSTAPEVSGITTAIGANGALEIWLNTTNTADGNYIPGNIVELAAATYGLQKITLLPSALNEASAGVLSSNFLKYPEYGADGRPGSLLNTSGAATGTFVTTDGGLTGNFFENDATGVRGVGVASGLTDRQVAYRSAKQTASTNKSLATSKVVTSLNTNGSVLGNIVIKKATGGTEYTKAELEALGTIIDDLEEAIEYIEIAYEEMIIAIAASDDVQPTFTEDMSDDEKADLLEAYDEIYANYRTLFNSELTIYTFADSPFIRRVIVQEEVTGEEEGTGQEEETESGGETETTTPVPTYQTVLDLTGSKIIAAINALETTKANVAAARDAHDDATPTDGKYTWNAISDVVNKLINTAAVDLNDDPVSSIDTDNLGALASSIMANGINITLNNGSGAYVEIADHCGDFSATVTMTNVTVTDEVTFETLTANMATDSEVETPYLEQALEEVNDAGTPTGDGGAQKPMTEFYGFIIDLSFKTNAANSNLLLQTTAKDRIYSDNNNADTQGAGSYMTYSSTELTTAQIKNLMKCIRIVFFAPAENDGDTNDIIGFAMLDTETATTSADGVTAQMYMAERKVSHYKYNGVSYYVKATTTEGTTTYEYFSDAAMETKATLPEAVATGAGSKIPDAFEPVYEYVKKTTTKTITGADSTTTEVTVDDPTITALTQNQALNLSVLVYLDGETITNGDVAAETAESVTGTMNLQFASDANLVPMEYGELHTPVKDAGNGGTQSGGGSGSESGGEGSGT